MGERKFVGYFRLVEACERPGGPVCRCVEAESRGYLDALRSEQATDPDTPRVIRASWGFCKWHTWMLLEIENPILGAAILYDDLVKLVLRRIERVDDGEKQRGWLTTLMVSAFPTFITAVEAHAAHPGVEALIEMTREKWTSVGRDLASFVNAHDYRNRQPYTEAEAASSRRAVAKLAGAKKAFGNDLRTCASVGWERGTLRPRTPVATETNGNSSPSHSEREQTP